MIQFHHHTTFEVLPCFNPFELHAHTFIVTAAWPAAVPPDVYDLKVCAQTIIL